MSAATASFQIPAAAAETTAAAAVETTAAPTDTPVSAQDTVTDTQPLVIAPAPTAGDAGNDTENDGRFSSITIGADGLPIISHRDLTAGALRVTHCGNAACTAGNRSTAIDDPGNFVGYSTSIAVGSDGLPVVAHLDGDADALRVGKCGTRTCQ